MRRSTRPRPARLVVLSFTVVIGLGTLLLWLPVSTVDGRDTSLLTALFTSTSATCVTGLVVVDTATHWTAFGKLVILGLIQVGGFGIMTLGSVIAIVVARRLGLRQQMLTMAETGAMTPRELRHLVRVIAVATIAIEAVVAVALGLRFWWTGDLAPGRAMVHGVFHAVSAFNNAGFALYSDSLVRFVSDLWVNALIASAVVVGGLGFPVLADLAEHRRAVARWSLHTKITLLATGVLLLSAAALIAILEWSNGATLGALDPGQKLVAAGFHGVMPRTAGFNTLDVASMRESTLFATDGLMLVGGGSASTAGGIKVGTFALLAFVIWAELRGTPDVSAFGRRIPTALQRQALSVALSAVGVIAVGTVLLMELSELPLSGALFEVISAFGTVGLSTGVTEALDSASRLLVVLFMFIGRVGPLTFGAALVLRGRARRFRHPEEGVLIG